MLERKNSVAYMCGKGASRDEIQARLGYVSEQRYLFEMRNAVDEQKLLLNRMQFHAYKN